MLGLSFEKPEALGFFTFGDSWNEVWSVQFNIQQLQLFLQKSHLQLLQNTDLKRPSGDHSDTMVTALCSGDIPGLAWGLKTERRKHDAEQAAEIYDRYRPYVQKKYGLRPSHSSIHRSYITQPGTHWCINLFPTICISTCPSTYLPSHLYLFIYK